jgi:hypothetical protein
MSSKPFIAQAGRAAFVGFTCVTGAFFYGITRPDYIAARKAAAEARAKLAAGKTAVDSAPLPAPQQ